MPKILLIGNYPHDRQYSMQRFSNLMHSALAAAGHEVRLIRPEPVFGRLWPAATGFGKWLGYVDKYILFAIRLAVTVRLDRSRSLVAHICDHSNAMYAGLLGRVPHVVTVHDLLAVRRAMGEIAGGRAGFTGRVQQAWVRRGLGRAQSCVCVSHQTARELLRLVDRPRSRTAVVANGIDPIFLENSISPADETNSPAKWTPGGRYILHVGSNSWYKNRLGVLRIFIALRAKLGRAPRLLLVGPAPSAEMSRLVEEFDLQDSVVFVEDASADHLRRLYEGAELLIFPSLAEGFGWPIVEAQALGCPVVTSDRAPLTEVGGSAARYCDPEDPAAAARVVAEVLRQTPDEREAMSCGGRANAARFGLSTMREGYEAVYESLLQVKDARVAERISMTPRAEASGFIDGE